MPGSNAAEAWERFAREDAEWYVQTPSRGQRPWFEHGEGLVEEMLARAAPLMTGWSRALEIGCGPGRLTIPVARRFEHVTAVDIAPTMLSRLAENCRERGISNVRAMTPSEAWDEPGVDLAYSLQVFQHIPDQAVIRSYVERTAHALQPEGLAYLHFDSRAATAAYRVRNIVPDPLLPRSWRRDIRRVRLAPETIEAMVAAAGLDVIAEYAPASHNHVVIARRTVAAAH